MSVDLQGKKILIAHSGVNDLEMLKAIAREIDDDFQVQPDVKCYSSYPNFTTINQSIDDYMCDVLIVLNLSNLYSSSGIAFLRNFWADIILNTKYRAVPPTIIMFGSDKDELRKQDPRFDISKTDGIGFVVLGDDLVAKIQSTMAVQPTIDNIKSCLLKSCETNRKQLEHDLRNYDGPYSLLVGAYYAGEFEGRSGLDDELVKLYQRKMHEELKICHAASYIDVFQSLEEEGHSLQLPICDKFAGRKILLIDDEYETAGWEIALKAIFGDRVVLDTYKGKNWNKSRDLVDDITKCYSLTDSSTMMPYDLILMDLYLSDQDKAKKKDDSFTEFASKKIIEKIRKKKKDDIPIILFTASKHAERIDALKETGGDIKYFPKKAFFEKQEAKKYFNDFRKLIEQLLSQERLTLREILTEIKNYHSISTHKDKDDIVSLLGDAHKKLKSYFDGGEIKSAVMDIGNALEKFFYKSSVSKSFLTQSVHKEHSDINKFRAYICYQLRSSFIRHFDRNPLFEEVLFAFFLCFKVLTTNSLKIRYYDPCPQWDINSTAVEMVNSICKPCTLSIKICRNKLDKRGQDDTITLRCEGIGQTDPIVRASLLSLHANLISKEAGQNRAFFLYFYYILKLKNVWQIDLDNAEEILIKYAFTKRGEKYCPAFNSNGWDGLSGKDLMIESPLGKLPIAMVMITKREPSKSSEPEHIRFELTERFRLG